MVKRHRDRLAAGGGVILVLLLLYFWLRPASGPSGLDGRLASIQAREAVLMEDLYRFRDVIDQYYADKGRYPASLETLVEDGYLRKLPADPITGTADWAIVLFGADPSNPGEELGLYDVHSASRGVSLSGTPYREW
jgi:general secretion pathway protein G